MPTYRTGNNAYAIQQLGTGGTGHAQNVAGSIGGFHREIHRPLEPDIRSWSFVPAVEVPASGGSTCAFVVGNSGALTAGDIVVRDRIVALGHTVFVVDDAAAADTGRDFVVIAESCLASTVAAKYRNVTMPVLVLEPGIADDMDMASAGATTGAAEDNVIILDAAHALAAGLSGTVNVMIPATRVDYNNASELAASSQQVYRTEASATQIVGYGYSAGATMQNSHVAEARRAYCGLAPDGSLTSIAANGIALLDAAITWVAPAAGGSISRTATDSLTFSDTLARLFTGARAPTDSLAFSDSGMRTLVLARSVTDSWTFSDTAARIIATVRSAADVLTTSDTVARVGTFARIVADNVTHSDIASRVATLARAVSDVLTFSDSATGIRTIVRSAVDSLTHSDAATRLVTLARTATDSRTYSDTAARVLAAARTATDSLTHSDAATRVGTFLRSVADSLTLSDIAEAIKTGTIVRTAADVLTHSDTAARVVSLARTASDSHTYGDTASRVLTAVRSATDSLTTSDTASRVLSAVRSAMDSLIHSDVAAAVSGGLAVIGHGIAPVITAIVAAASRIVGTGDRTETTASTTAAPDITDTSGPTSTSTSTNDPDITEVR